MKETLKNALGRLSVEDTERVVSQSQDPKALILSLNNDDVALFEYAAIDSNRKKLVFVGWGNGGYGYYDSKNTFFKRDRLQTVPIYNQLVKILRKPFINDAQPLSQEIKIFSIINEGSYPHFAIDTTDNALGQWLKCVLPILGMHPERATGHSTVIIPQDEIEFEVLTLIISSLEDLFKKNQLSNFSFKEKPIKAGFSIPYTLMPIGDDEDSSQFGNLIEDTGTTLTPGRF